MQCAHRRAHSSNSQNELPDFHFEIGLLHRYRWEQFQICDVRHAYTTMRTNPQISFVTWEIYARLLDIAVQHCSSFLCWLTPPHCCKPLYISFLVMLFLLLSRLADFPVPESPNLRVLPQPPRPHRLKDNPQYAEIRITLNVRCVCFPNATRKLLPFALLADCLHMLYAVYVSFR